MKNRPPLVVARELTKHYNDRAVVNAVNFQVQAGECWGLLGPNGAGKTTLLRMLLGKTPPSSGALEVFGQDLTRHATALRARMGVVPQHDALDPDFTVAENLRVFGSYFGLNRKQVDARLDRLLEFSALQGRANAPITTLSGGMQRRLSLSRALVNEPDLLILDEPTTGLDPQARQLIWQRLRSLSASGQTIIITTHYMEEAERLCDRVTIMDNGKLLESDAPDRLVAHHVEPQVVEVHGENAGRWRTLGPDVVARHERAGDTHFYYCNDAAPLLRAVEGTPGVRFLHRPASLEDVFLKLTGRDLRDD